MPLLLTRARAFDFGHTNYDRNSLPLRPPPVLNSETLPRASFTRKENTTRANKYSAHTYASKNIYDSTRSKSRAEATCMTRFPANIREQLNECATSPVPTNHATNPRQSNSSTDRAPGYQCHPTHNRPIGQTPNSQPGN